MDTSVLLFTLTAAVLTGLLFGVAPAAQTTKPSLVSARNESGSGTTAGRLGRQRSRAVRRLPTEADRAYETIETVRRL